MGKQLVIVGADFSAVAIDTGPRYQIRGVITNGILTGRTSVVAGGSATVTITPNSGFTYPASVNDINVTGATKGTYDVASGQLNISNATGDVTITATCPVSGGGGETNITSSFTSTWASGPIYAAAGSVSSDTNWVHNDYVDVSAYSSLKITIAKTTTATGTLGYSFYNASKGFVSGNVHHYGSSSYGYQEDTITVPSGAKYIRTTWFSQESATAKGVDFNAFSCKGVS